MSFICRLEQWLVSKFLKVLLFHITRPSKLTGKLLFQVLNTVFVEGVAFYWLFNWLFEVQRSDKMSINWHAFSMRTIREQDLTFWARVFYQHKHCNLRFYWSSPFKYRIERFLWDRQYVNYLSRHVVQWQLDIF